MILVTYNAVIHIYSYKYLLQHISKWFYTLATPFKINMMIILTTVFIHSMKAYFSVSQSLFVHMGVCGPTRRHMVLAKPIQVCAGLK